MKEITVKLLKIIKHSFSNTTYSKAMRFRFTMYCNIKYFDGIENGGGWEMSWVKKIKSYSTIPEDGDQKIDKEHISDK